MLLFVKPALLALINRGRKTTTIRPWKTCRLQVGGTLHFPHGGNDPMKRTHARITAVSRVRFGDLTAADARRDGFPSLRAFRATFLDIYPRTTDDSTVIVLTFVVVTKVSASSARA